MSWSRLQIRLGNGVMNAAVLSRLDELFERWYSAFEPGQAAMFTAHDPHTAEVTVYFTPAANAFAVQFDGVESCEAPIADKYFEINAGAEAAWALVRPPPDRLEHAATRRASY